MEFRQLQVFDAVAREKTIVGAANALDLAPSSVSEHLRNLERSLGVALFDRRPRGMQLTPAGDRLRGWAKRLLDDLAEARREVVGAPQAVRLGALESLAAVHVPRIVARLAERGADLQVMTTMTANRDEIMAEVMTGRLDAGLLLDSGARLGGLGFGPAPEPLAFLDLEAVPVSLVVAPDHPLASRVGPVGELSDDLSDNLAGFPLIGNTPRCSFWLAADARFDASIRRIEAGSVAVAKAWAEQGLGAAFLPDFATGTECAAGTLLRLPQHRTALALRLVWRNDRETDPAVRQLLYAVADPS